MIILAIVCTSVAQSNVLDWEEVSSVSPKCAASPNIESMKDVIKHAVRSM
jgi:hypothetical protein